MDVVNKVRDAVFWGSGFRVDNGNMGGDPAQNSRKTLTITYIPPGSSSQVTKRWDETWNFDPTALMS